MQLEHKVCSDWMSERPWPRRKCSCQAILSQTCELKNFSNSPKVYKGSALVFRMYKKERTETSYPCPKTVSWSPVCSDNQDSAPKRDRRLILFSWVSSWLESSVRAICFQMFNVKNQVQTTKNARGFSIYKPNKINVSKNYLDKADKRGNPSWPRY